HDISNLVIAGAPGVWPLLPLGAIRVALDLPFALPHGPAWRLVKGRAILGPIDHALSGFACCGRRRGLQVDGFAREKRFDLRTSQIGGDRRSDEAGQTGCNDAYSYDITHDLNPP